MNKFFGKNPVFNGAVHLIGGIGIGILITYPLVGSHPLRWGVALITLAVLGHIWAATK